MQVRHLADCPTIRAIETTAEPSRHVSGIVLALIQATDRHLDRFTPKQKLYSPGAVLWPNAGQTASAQLPGNVKISKQLQGTVLAGSGGEGYNRDWQNAELNIKKIAYAGKTI